MFRIVTARSLRTSTAGGEQPVQRRRTPHRPSMRSTVLPDALTGLYSAHQVISLVDDSAATGFRSLS